MKRTLALLFVSAILAIACESVLDITSTPESATALPATANPTPRDPSAPTRVPQPTPTQTPATPPVPMTVPTSRVNVATVEVYERGDNPEFIAIEYPPWINDYPQMAWSIADSEVIAKATLVSIESVVSRRTPEGEHYDAELAYTFRIHDYLKGDGSNEIVVVLPFRQLTDDIDHYAQEESNRIAAGWLRDSKALFDGKEDGILLLKDWDRRPSSPYSFGRVSNSNYEFTSLTYWEWSAMPVIGAAWLPEFDESIFQYQPLNGETTTISHSDLSSRIRDIRQLMHGEYSACIRTSLLFRSRVRSRLLGTYFVDNGFGGYYQPEPFLQGSVSQYDREAWAYRWLLELYRPPIPSPRFSDYWLDGKDQDQFRIGVVAYSPMEMRERIYAAEAPLPGEYSVFYSQFHRSLPCDAVGLDTSWAYTNTMEWIVTIIDR